MRSLVRVAAGSLAIALSVGLMQAQAQATSVGEAVAVTADDTTTPVEPIDPIDPPIDPPVVERAPAPLDLVPTLGDGQVTVAFSQPEPVEPVLNYEYAFSVKGPWSAFDPAVTASPVTITGLPNGARYRVWLRAVTASGPGIKSSYINFKLPALEPPAPSKPVEFEVGGKKIANGMKVKPGDPLKIRNVPPGAVVQISDMRDEAFVFEARETNRSRMYTTDSLPPARRLVVSVVDTEGRVVSKVTFITEKAENSFSLQVWPKEDNLGAGVPLVVDFGVPITNKAEVEKALKVTSDKDFGEAGWFWVNSSKAVFRPRHYWPGNATITLEADLASVEGAKGYWGPKVSSSFSTGDQVVLKVNLRSHTMKYQRNGKLEHTFPISGGMSGWLTEAGTKVLTAHIPNKRLYNPDPEEGWDVTVDWAIRVNDNGEYIHSAPWNYSIGYANTSHGCTNMTVSDMGWLFRNTKFGDVAEYTGSSVKIGTDDYLAGYWNYTWPEWKRGSALFDAKS